ncbi:hypothetical protein [Leifsonia poae]
MSDPRETDATPQPFEYPDNAGYPDGTGTLDEGTDRDSHDEFDA